MAAESSLQGPIALRPVLNLGAFRFRDATANASIAKLECETSFNVARQGRSGRPNIIFTADLTQPTVPPSRHECPAAALQLSVGPDATYLAEVTEERCEKKGGFQHALGLSGNSSCKGFSIWVSRLDSPGHVLKTFFSWEPVAFWTWLSSSKLAIITAASVFRWDVEATLVPDKLFDRADSWKYAKVVSYAEDCTGQWAAPILQSPVGSPDREKAPKSAVQLYSIRSSKLICNEHEVHAACFVGAGQGSHALLAMVRLSGGDGSFQLCIHELRQGTPGNSETHHPRSKLQLPVPHQHQQAAPSADFPIALCINEQLQLAFVVARGALLFVCALDPLTLLCRNRISTHPIISAIGSPTTGGLHYLDRQQVVNVTVDTAALPDFLRHQRGGAIRLAAALQGRLDDSTAAGWAAGFVGPGGPGSGGSEGVIKAARAAAAASALPDAGALWGCETGYPVNGLAAAAPLGIKTDGDVPDKAAFTAGQVQQQAAAAAAAADDLAGEQRTAAEARVAADEAAAAANARAEAADEAVAAATARAEAADETAAAAAAEADAASAQRDAAISRVAVLETELADARAGVAAAGAAAVASSPPPADQPGLDAGQSPAQPQSQPPPPPQPQHQSPPRARRRKAG